jgi:DNA polymerase III epsilon subunit-like protein
LGHSAGSNDDVIAMLCVLDLETTGTTPTQDRITEIGLIRYENGIEVGRWNIPAIPANRSLRVNGH